MIYVKLCCESNAAFVVCPCCVGKLSVHTAFRNRNSFKHDSMKKLRRVDTGSGLGCTRLECKFRSGSS